MPRPQLYARIDARIDTMISAGLVEEVESLLDEGYSPDLPALSAIGYQEIVGHILGWITLDEAVARIKRRTRQFVRRQANWFKEGDPQIHWFEVGPLVIDEMEKVIRDWIATN
jgi:tRNA dimethylallyltransferase